MDLDVARLLLASASTQGNGTPGMSEIDPTERTELTGPWAGFGFQGGHMWTPKSHSLFPEDMAWWSLTCNIAREWRLMMAEARSAAARSAECPEPLWHKDPSVINLRDVLRRRREKRSAMKDGARFADRATVVRSTRGPRSSRRG